MKVHELVEAAHPSTRTIVPGDVARDIRWVHCLEIPRPAPFLRGGEVILSAGVWSETGVPARVFVDGMLEADVAALGYGLLGPGDVPEDLIEACTRQNLTLFEVGVELSFISLIQKFVEREARDREEELRKTLRGGMGLGTDEESQRLARDLIEHVISGASQLQIIARLLETFQIDPGAPLIVAVLDADGEDGAAKIAADLFDRELVGVVSTIGDEIVGVCQWVGSSHGAHAAAATAEERLAGRAVGIGTPAGIGGLFGALEEARRAHRIAHMRALDNAASGLGQVPASAALLQTANADQVTELRRELLGPLIAHDRERRTQLLDTLHAFLASGGAWNVTASALHVHVNTLRHRLARVEELTGRDLGSMADRVDFYLCLCYSPPAGT